MKITTKITLALTCIFLGNPIINAMDVTPVPISSSSSTVLSSSSAVSPSTQIIDYNQMLIQAQKIATDLLRRNIPGAAGIPLPDGSPSAIERYLNQLIHLSITTFKQSEELLSVSVNNNDKYIVVRLIKLGADVNQEINNNRPLRHCVKNEHNEIYEEMVEILLRAGAQVNYRDRDNCTLLDLAVMRKSLKIVQLLVKAGAQINEVDDHGFTPFLRAIESGQENIIKYLLTLKRAHINQVNPKTGENSLLLAIKNGRINVLTMLIDAGAEVNRTTLYNARLLDNPKALEILTKAFEIQQKQWSNGLKTVKSMR